MLLAFFFCSIAVDWVSIIVEYCVVVPVLYLDFPDKSDSGERANRVPFFAVEVMVPD